MAIKQKRDKGLKILMTEATHSRLVALSESLGQSPATLASMAVSEYVARLTANSAMGAQAVKAMVDHIGPAFVDQMKLMAESP
jgi:hypothetical protein